MRPVPKIPQARFPAPKQPLGRSFGASIALHLVILALLVWRVDAAVEANAGVDDSRFGGGGGGGGREVTYIVLPPLPDAARRSIEEVETDPVPQVVPVFSPKVLRVVPVEQPIAVRTSRPPLRMAKARGSGDGITGGPGSGSGSGGGQGAGQGPGIGDGVGPGTGGEGGDVLPPSVRFSALPPMENRPASLRGRSFRVLFTVDPRGRVTSVRTDPRIDESGYRRRFLDAMKRYRFNPATRRDGTAVIGLATVTVTL